MGEAFHHKKRKWHKVTVDVQDGRLMKQDQGQKLVSRGAVMVVIPARKWPLGSCWMMIKNGRVGKQGLGQQCCQEAWLWL